MFKGLKEKCGRLEIKHGTTRTVILIGKYAIKIPLLKEYKGFLKGLLANMNERMIHHLCPNYFLPVLWSSRAGLIVVMPRVKATKQATWYLHAFMADLFHPNNDENSEALTARRYCEYVASNVAMYKGKPYCIDYGSYVYPDATEFELDGEMYYLKLKTKQLVEEKFGPQDWSHYGKENIQPVEEPYQICLELLDIPKFTADVESKDSDIPHGLLEVETEHQGQVVWTTNPSSDQTSESVERDSAVSWGVQVPRHNVPNEKIETPVVFDNCRAWNPVQ